MIEDVKKEGTDAVEVVSPVRVSQSVSAVDSAELMKQNRNVMLHEVGIREHYGSDNCVSDMATSEEIGTETLIRFLVKELCREIDNLAGNRMIALKNGELEKATVISSKRTEVVDRAIKAIMAQKEFDASTSIDVDSPSMRVVFHYFLEKCQESFQRAGMNAEISDTFFRNFNDICGMTWKKDLKKRIAEIRT